MTKERKKLTIDLLLERVRQFAHDSLEMEAADKLPMFRDPMSVVLTGLILANEEKSMWEAEDAAKKNSVSKSQRKSNSQNSKRPVSTRGASH